MGPFEAKGLWWLAGQSDESKRVPGVLTVDENGEAELSLIGTFTDETYGAQPEQGEHGEVSYTITEDLIAKSGVYPRILGVAGNTGYTLEDSFRTKRTS